VAISPICAQPAMFLDRFRRPAPLCDNSWPPRRFSPLSARAWANGSTASWLKEDGPPRLAAAGAVAAQAGSDEVGRIQSSSTLRERLEMVHRLRRPAAPAAHPSIAFEHFGADLVPVVPVAAFGWARPRRVFAPVDGAVVRGGAVGAAGGVAEAPARQTRPGRHSLILRLRNHRLRLSLGAMVIRNGDPSGLAAGRLRHAGQPELDAAVRHGAQRPLGGATAWQRPGMPVDVSPLSAATLAVGD
jgi:hypothetical protein